MRIITAAIALLIAFPAHADVLIDNVNGITLDAAGRVESFTGVLVDDDGRIEQLYRRNDKRPGTATYKVDGKRRVLMPGFIDSHVNVMKLGLVLLSGKAGAGEQPASEPRAKDRDLAFAKAQWLLLSQGITTVADMGTTIEDWQTYRRAGDLDALHIRIVGYANTTGNMALISGPGPTPWLYSDRLKLNGLYLKLDGELASNTALLKTADTQPPDGKGERLLTEIQLRNLMSRAAIENFQVAVAAHGDQAVTEVLDAIDELVETYQGDRRWRIEGAEVVDPADSSRLASRSVTVSVNPSRAMRDAAAVEGRLGPERAIHAHSWRSLESAGANIVLGSGDGPLGYRPFSAMAAAITRQDADGRPFGGWQPQEALNREQAVDAFTRSAAFALFAEGRLGRIAQGMRGDFILVDRDPFLSGASDFAETRVLQTWVGGKLVYEAGESPPEDR